MATSTAGSMDRTIFVAIDFGTTYSGIAWAAAARPESQNGIIQWPDAFSGSLEGVTSEKCPTELVYDRDGIRWGFQIKEGEQRHQWFKLGLDPESVLAEAELVRNYPHYRALPPPYSVTPEKLSTDFLNCLRNHTCAILSQKLSPSIVETSPFAFIITVPALWKDLAKDKTRQCAKDAGMGDNVMIISEPEAAAIHALDMMDPHGLQISESFVVCDAGGGTVDLITYEIMELKPVLKIREATAGKGGVCGSSILNRIFLKHLEDRFGTCRGWDEELRDEALEKFEKVTKRNFGGSLVDEYIIPVNGLRDNEVKGVKRGRYRMRGHDLVQVFRPVIKEIISLVQGQVDFCVMKPKAILLVGGFGANSYLREQLKKAFPAIEVMQPANAWTSVSRGGITIAMAEATPDLCRIKIGSRVARKFYGMTVEINFNEDEHDSWRKHWCNLLGRHRISVVDWLVAKGDALLETKPVVSPLCSLQLCTDGPIKSTTIRFYSFDDGVAPKYQDHNVKHLVTLTVDLSGIPTARYKTKTGHNGEKYYQINYQVKAIFCSAHTEYSLWFEGERYGSVQADYV